MENEKMIHNEIMLIIETALNSPYEYGTNDCNIVALRIIDLLCGTNWCDIAKYSTLKEGLKQLQDLGFNSTHEIIIKECKEIEVPIDGDIWVDTNNPLQMGIIVSNRLVCINDDHTAFKLDTKKRYGKYYRGMKQ
ncbi:TPA: ornithine carbamoyltransferase [Raoultella ornithinolytica]|nr:ornithine carbamoyltransferase [Raoultella ornithinolytica]HDT1249919.1 ornithine carbamoyltransferase [Raoultella ornithinolytica]